MGSRLGRRRGSLVAFGAALLLLAAAPASSSSVQTVKLPAAGELITSRAVVRAAPDPDSPRPAGPASPTARRAIRGRPRDRDSAQRRRVLVVRAELAGPAERSAGLGARRSGRPPPGREPDRGACRRRAGSRCAGSRRQAAARAPLSRLASRVPRRRSGGISLCRGGLFLRSVLRPVRAGDERLFEAERLARRRVGRDPRNQPARSCSARLSRMAACGVGTRSRGAAAARSARHTGRPAAVAASARDRRLPDRRAEDGEEGSTPACRRQAAGPAEADDAQSRVGVSAKRAIPRRSVRARWRPRSRPRAPPGRQRLPEAVAGGWRARSMCCLPAARAAPP